MSAYAKGAATEHALMAHAFAHGCLASRGAGSHGCDVFVTAPAGRMHWAVNVKRGRWAGPNERRDHLLYADYGWRPVLARQDLRKHRLVWTFAIVTKAGDMAPLAGAPWE